MAWDAARDGRCQRHARGGRGGGTHLLGAAATTSPTAIPRRKATLVSERVVALALPSLLLGVALLPKAYAQGEEELSREANEREEESRKRGFAMGVSGEFFRYKHVFHKGPSESDHNEALGVAAKIRCEVCTAVVGSLVAKAKSFSEDDLADMLEGNVEYEKTGDKPTDQMLSHKRGCNKHFKDELIAEGYVLRQCKEVVPGRTDSEPCLFSSGEKPNQQATDSYELWKEALFFACEQTVSHHGDAIAEYLAEALRQGGNRTDAVRTSCHTHARCAGARRAAGSSSSSASGASGAGGARGTAAGSAARAKGRKRLAAKGGSAPGAGEL